MPFMANMTHHQKRRLIGQLETITCDYLLLDLSAGTAFNTLDLALIADSGLFVTTPERTSIHSLLTFVKNLLLRATERSIARDPDLIDPMKRLFVQSVDHPVVTLPDVTAELGRLNPRAAEELRSLCRRVRPRLVYNMGEDTTDLDVLSVVDRTFAEILGLGCDHIGFLPFDPLVRQAGRSGQPFLLQHGGSATGTALRRIAQRIVRFWGAPIPRSGELLRRHAEATHSERVGAPRPG
jgi:flagellar biosynthesis protein FlhG